jgi:hypothetical protein
MDDSPHAPGRLSPWPSAITDGESGQSGERSLFGERSSERGKEAADSSGFQGMDGEYGNRPAMIMAANPSSPLVKFKRRSRVRVNRSCSRRSVENRANYNFRTRAAPRGDEVSLWRVNCVSRVFGVGASGHELARAGKSPRVNYLCRRAHSICAGAYLKLSGQGFKDVGRRARALR